MQAPGECSHVVIQTELSRLASGQAAQCESPWWPGSTTQEQGITVTAGRSVSWPAFPSGRASPPSACSAHPPSPAPPLLPAVSRWAPAAPRGEVQLRSSKVRSPVCLLPPSTASLPLLLSCSGCTGLSRAGCLAITWGPSWLLRGKSRRPLLLDRPARPCSGLNTGRLSLQDPKGCLSTRSEGS